MRNSDLAVEKFGTKIRIKIKSKEGKKIAPDFIDIPFHLAAELISGVDDVQKKIMNSHNSRG